MGTEIGARLSNYGAERDKKILPRHLRPSPLTSDPKTNTSKIAGNTLTKFKSNWYRDCTDMARKWIIKCFFKKGPP